MVELNQRDRTIRIKIVYYGPPLGGKTTNLQVLHRAADARRRGDLISVNSAQDRTILFDLLPLKTTGFRGFDLRVQLLAVPGQPMYAATRKLVLKGADSLVFVANSALDRWEENIQSLREMTSNLLSHHLEPSTMPLVLQYNKRDLPQVLEVQALDRVLNARHTDALPAVAVRGEGVLETLIAILARTVHDLGSRYAILDLKGGIPPRAWAEDAVQQLFGTQRLYEPPAPDAPGRPEAPVAAPTPPPAARAPAVKVPPAPGAERPETPQGRTVVRASPTPSGETPPGGAADARAGSLVESYAEVAAQLGAALTDLRDEREGLRQQLKEVRQALHAADEVLSGTPLDGALRPLLGCMAGIAGVEPAAFWVSVPGEPPRAAALVGLEFDPVLAVPAALRHVTASATRGSAPAFAEAKDNLDLAQALEMDGHRFAAVLAVPFRTPGGLQAVAAFYYGADTARPGPGALERLAEVARVLSASLELAATLRTVKAAERALELALAGSASLRGLETVVRSLEQLRDRLGEIRGRPDAPAWFADQYLRLAPALGSALEDGRSLLGFARGELRRESVYLEDLVAELRTPEVAVELDPAVETIAADATLLRVALRAVADEVRSCAGGNSAPLSIRVGASAAGLQIAVRAASPGGGAASRAVNAGLGLNLARRIVEMHGGTLEPGRAQGEIVLVLPPA